MCIRINSKTYYTLAYLFSRFKSYAEKNHDIMIDWVKFRVKYVFAGGMVKLHPTTLSTFLASSGP